MATRRLLIVLTLLNLALLVFTLGVMRPVVAGGVAPVLRGRSLEIVENTGRVRASLSVHPAGTSAQGDHYPETVLLRLITERGRPTVKVGTSERTAAMSLAGPTKTKNTYVILEATGTASSLKLRNENGREQVVTPQQREDTAVFPGNSRCVAKPLTWLGASLEDIRGFPGEARRSVGFQLRRAGGPWSE